MAALAFLVLIAWACKVTWDDVHGKLREHRQEALAANPQPTPMRRRAAGAKHDAGWIAREVLTGFPVTRAAFSSAWLAHKAQAEQHRLRGDHAKITYANAVAARNAARAQHPASQTPPPSAAPTPPAPGNGQVLPFPARHLSSVPDPPDVPAQPTGSNGRHAAPDPPTQVPPTTTPGVTVPSGPATTTATEFTYAQTLATADQVTNLAESHQAEMGKLQVPQMVDSLSGAGLDSDTLGRGADLHDAWVQAQETQKRVIDTAAAFRAAVQRHAPVADAHQSAPGGGAEKPFYVET